MKIIGKTAIITGGSRGIGKAVAAAFLRNGANVMLAARSRDELVAAQSELAAKRIELNKENAQNGGSVAVFVTDVSRRADVAALVKKTVATFGGVDIVVNAAGAYGAIGPVATVDVEEWKKTFDINLFGTFNVIQEVLPLFIRSGTASAHKKIINFSGGGDGPLPSFSAYNASKVAIVRLTETLAKELAEQNIDVNAVAPGPVNTKILEDGLAAGEKMIGKEMYEKFLKQKHDGGVPPEKAAELCVFLASSDSDGLSGKLVSAIYDNWNEWTKDDIIKLMASDKLNLRRVNFQ